MGMLGALIGAAIDRRDGKGGLKGALIGAAVQTATRYAVPLGALAILGLVMKRRGRQRRKADPSGQHGFPPEAEPRAR